MYMPQDGHWLANFEVIAPPKRVVFPPPKNENSPVVKTVVSDPIFWRVFCFFGENFVTPFSTLANIKGSLPTYSTTPARLRWRTKTDGEDFLDFWLIMFSNIVENFFFKSSFI